MSTDGFASSRFQSKLCVAARLELTANCTIYRQVFNSVNCGAGERRAVMTGCTCIWRH